MVVGDGFEPTEEVLVRDFEGNLSESGLGSYAQLDTQMRVMVAVLWGVLCEKARVMVEGGAS